MASRAREKVFEGTCASLALPILLLRNGLICNWKHLALPLLCALPIKKTAGLANRPDHAPAAANREEDLAR